MAKKILAGAMLVVVLASAAIAAEETPQTAAAQPISTEKPTATAAENLDHFGRNLFYGIGAVVAAPLRLLQDALNTTSQGASGEKLVDHTN